ncbi:endoplasmic reticulum Oxidoreductin 1-domain-containing protein [Phakopsora pachyrhizi]|uniref:Endoplasmic reticulum Oxidoreductin 1-domain-containing protein n=1 Tax=Phakopsora pachyrhizi TaxID=170000 RepID=A0AAV0BGE4_PHAPC|nr:endoplasmic reticulum Oxidoreductin 1-domain-containing protein [Phakopsora pachyrhizi]CAH7686246.1 endoplasmic reticulum Oxidoreductin 1-domain-containing protein [Phakopsora pachyrhizi]
MANQRLVSITLKLLLIPLSIFLNLTSASESVQSSFDTPSIPIEQLSCRPSGLIQDTSCHYETVDEVSKKLHSQLSSAVQLPVFRYHKVDLFRQCMFWSENGLCGNRACAVDELDKDNVPAYWRTSELSDLRTTDSRKIPINLENRCVVKEQDYCVLDGENGVPPSGVYVDLLANPERFTGYSGESAHRVWRAIYEENCFDIKEQPMKTPFAVPPPSPFAGLESKPLEERQKEESCLEKRVYYRLLSGLHTSISMHICDEYLDPATGKWVPNLQCYLNRIGLHPHRLKNLYFAYSLMLRALSRSASYINSARVELCTGDDEVDRRTREVLTQLTDTAESYPVTFDETKMFSSRSAKQSNLKEEFKQHFRNVSRIMDCVGCDKCRLWGKLQVMGLGTALKLLFEYEDEGESKNSDFQLTRPELLAFINTLHRLSESLVAVEKFRKLWEQRSHEGTLPIQVVDEKLDALASGRAAKAISLNPGLGPRADSTWSGVNPATSMPIFETKTDQLVQKPRQDKNQELAVPEPTDIIVTRTDSPSLAPSRRSTPSQSALLSLHRQSNQPKSHVYDDKQVNQSNRNRSADTSEPSRIKPKREVVFLSTLTRPASRLIKMFSSKCLDSISICSHWLAGLVGHVKMIVLPRTDSDDHMKGFEKMSRIHEEDDEMIKKRSGRGKEL